MNFSIYLDHENTISIEITKRQSSVKLTLNEWNRLRDELSEQLREQQEITRRPYFRQNGNITTSNPCTYEDDNARDVWGSEEIEVGGDSGNEVTRFS